ncbi:peptide ABC transporter substrate-binding protein [Microbacterium sp. EYE_5]|uniref:ABC transporter substrate-binding protein n=1 Tax=unclassified Microbacterium TaxID=2609290 RepID=UPI00200383CE|nr:MULTISPECIES: ABC transporter substrate-binding protein [unclassified Microbacterium]MCK6079141.1 peptide ABC transporter substrate-binding protein [Microbacterium sp. EYE_382]MCK6084411.1 peptide ABC transporter substrate-binding protein [Microbacterium sp. EYE_384]MCK6123360.1 peptide ABC transporter substrate-binding protein [Microbacterium sp. EYE_80]MCK6125175.1 peptide ABC transporter substrate-binding protein [Microbacterium sp. EYE_79]MCK6140095.1 peptide ABC transporter substrate-b
MFRWKATAAVAVVAALALAGCAGGETPGTGGEGGKADRLTLISIAAPTSYDIGAGAEWGNRSEFFEAVFDTLLRKDSSGEIQPNLATEWSYNEDNTVLTLTLRDDVTFTDDTPLDAEAVVGSLERFRDGTSPQAATLAGKEFAAPDATTVTITQDAPDPSLENLLSIAPGLVQAPSSFDDENSATTPVGSGPYILDSASSVTGTTYNYTANPDYWNADAVKYENLTINVMEDTTAILNAIKAGEANGAKIADNNTIAEVEGAGWTIESNELDFQGLLLLDRAGTMAPELADVKVRQAINMAFDREALLQSLQSGYGTVTEQVFPATSEAYDESLDGTYAYDPDAAKALLADAGYPDGFTLNMMSTPAFQTTFDLVAQQLSDIGITVNYTDPGTGNFITDMLAPKYPATWMALEQNPDWQLINFMIAPSATFNPFKYQDDTVDGYIETIQRGSEEEATAAVKELNKYIVDQAWFAPFFRVQGSFAVDTNTDLAFWPTNAYPSIFDFSPKN